MIMSPRPSRRTASPIVTDCESATDGLNVWVNRAGRELPME